MFLGDLVESKRFRGIGKIIELLPDRDLAVVGFFESPLRPATNQVEVKIKSLVQSSLCDEAVVYCRDPETMLWSRGRYLGERVLERKHLVAFRRGENALVPTEDLYYINLGGNHTLNPGEFLAAKANDAPFFFPLREAFVTSYIEQRASCRSISSLPSSSVELEQHQLAVVRRVLQDPVPKYLLADEVGLGKTIEAGLIIREHILERQRAARVIIAVPKNLISQWHQELNDRFFLGDLLEDGDWEGTQIKICAHEDLLSEIGDNWRPSLLTIDEAHQVANFAMSSDESERELFAAYAKFADLAEVSLLLSGTPLKGNEHNFLAMLHCISPQAYELNDDGIKQFAKRVQKRERLGGLYGAITTGTPNSVLEDILDELTDLFPSDDFLMEKIERLRPMVDFFAPQDSDERDTEILGLRRYIGEHYRLHHRLLRNRRENSDLEILFPGLDGLSKHHWSVSLQDITLDEAIDDLRIRALMDPDFFQCIASDGILPWVDDLLTSPLCVEQRAKDLFERYGNEASDQEREFLEYLVEIAKKEQYQKDQLLTQVLQNWLDANPNGKAVVFCTRHEIAQFVGEQLQNEITGGVVFNWDKEVEFFNSPENETQVLVCDQRGEDGLNFNGGSRLAVHYSIPRDISRIEQRLGRFNRYSANLKGAKPVQSVVLLPEPLGISGHWVDLLNDVMQIFNRTLASLQHMLEKQIDTTWTAYCQEGYAAFDKTKEVLSGDTGLIAAELKRVKAQEELMSMEEEVEEAFEFADQLEEADEIAEDQVQRMTGWITKALNFRLMGNPMETFRFKFMLDNPRTLVDVDSFLTTCMLGLDLNGGYPPVTMPMSASRTAVSDGKGLYPFRFGQPFLDTIWDLMQTDPRGTSMAFLRSVPGQDYEEPEVYLRFSWFICAHEHDANRIEQRIADEAFPPQVKTFWLRQDGQIVDGDETAVLDVPYRSYATSDLNLRSSLWPKLEEWFPSDQWERMILSLAEQAQAYCLDSYNEQNVSLHPQLIAIKAVVLCNADLLSMEDDL